MTDDEHQGFVPGTSEWQDAWERQQQRADDLQVENKQLCDVMARIRAADERFWADLGEFLTDETITELRERGKD